MTLQNELTKLEETVKKFKIGASSYRKETIEDKILETVNEFGIPDVKLLTIKAKVAEAQQPHENEEFSNSDLVKILDEYEQELTKFMLMKSLWQQSSEASVVQAITNGDTPVDKETFRFVDESINEILNLQILLHDLMSEEQQITQQIAQKTGEYKLALFNNKKKVEKSKNKKQQVSPKILQQKKTMELKLEKMNTMMYLMTNLLTVSDVNYMTHTKWTKLLCDTANHVTMKDLVFKEK
ncbi:hypothetical protein L9F63_006985 [Diploptera punctata]|uniref:Uncharacterized protein n=1 Tax=Diploptera punctata TaxID=6984 RepID=A0AAD8E3Q7_DIPPU|nr:hypothetical protein L9F63_006985 [Diploptera punctata]